MFYITTDFLLSVSFTANWGVFVGYSVYQESALYEDGGILKKKIITIKHFLRSLVQG